LVESSVLPTIEKPLVSTDIADSTILVVEDQDELRTLISETLSDNGFKVISAENGAKALEIFKADPKKFDMVVTDVVMPEMGGRALANELTKILPDFKILYLSGYTEDTLAGHGISGQHPHFLEKPFSRASLLQKIQEILAGTNLQ
jgi:CheY-like chemotaxis protein